eukprot:366406-Chlamydomonas_euryale.AAC.25
MDAERERENERRGEAMYQRSTCWKIDRDQGKAIVMVTLYQDWPPHARRCPCILQNYGCKCCMAWTEKLPEL